MLSTCFLMARGHGHTDGNVDSQENSEYYTNVLLLNLSSLGAKQDYPVMSQSSTTADSECLISKGLNLNQLCLR